MKGAAVWIAPESPEEVPEPDADEPLEPERPVVAVAASREAVEAAEPPAEMADWVASASRELPEADAEASLKKLEYAEPLAELPAAEPAATPLLVPLVGIGMRPEPAAVPPGK
jgi:hypothetical protein